MRVLLVEDNPRMQDEVRHIVAAIPGARLVAVAASQAQASGWLAAHPEGWDLALVDLFLGQGHGFQVLRACRKAHPQQRAVVLSNYTRDPVREHARQAGADAVFDKSFEMDALVDYCREFARELTAGMAPESGGLPAWQPRQPSRNALGSCLK
jgi:DNA-binding NarL/FixJ family response regulator